MTQSFEKHFGAWNMDKRSESIRIWHYYHDICSGYFVQETFVAAERFCLNEYKLCHCIHGNQNSTSRLNGI